jgi:hypothetical protein
MTDDRRAVLEGIAFGDDARITPGDRLAAIRELRERYPEPAYESPPDLAAMSAEELDERMDAELSADLPQLVARELDGAKLKGVAAETWAAMPKTAAAFAAQVERRAEARARELADADRIEREVEAEAQERAEKMYRERAFSVVLDEDATKAEAGTESPANSAARAPGLPPGLTEADLARGWPERKRRGIRRGPR